MNSEIRKLLIFFLLLNIISSYAQDDNTDVNIQDYTPSVLLSSGNWEYKFFNNLYTQTKGFDDSGNKSDLSGRSSYFSSINQYLYGVSSKINIGVEFWVKSARYDVPGSSAFNVLNFSNSAMSRAAITGIGPKIKISPFKKIKNLAVQSTFLVPLARDLDGSISGSPYLSENSYIWYTQIFYDKSIGKKYQLFFQFAPWIYYKKKKQENDISRWSYSNPLSLFVSYFPIDRLTIYAQNEFWPSIGEMGITSWFLQEGIGLKYQVIPGFIEAEVLLTRFVLGRNTGAGDTYNFGLRFIR